jgi:NAD(P)-dependent dehydrogenase (short-subunit alcohol dehydrogenase family)
MTQENARQKSALNMFRLDGRSAYVTGGGSGIGFAIAAALAEAGADVAIVGRNRTKLQDAAHKLSAIGTRIETIYADISKKSDVMAMSEELRRMFGGLDVAVNNAGTCTISPAEDTPEDQLDAVFDTNIKGTFLCCQEAAKLMKASGGGSIVNIASISAHIANVPQQIAHYCASKAAVAQMTKAIALEWVKYGIRVNCISPGFVFTEMSSDPFQVRMHPVWRERTPMARMGTPDELKGTALLLASNASSYTTGAEFIIDGGYTVW